MADMFSDLKNRFKAGSILYKYIYINVGVFIAMRLMVILFRLFNADAYFLDYLELPSSIPLLLYRPWTLFTYMFIHRDVLHILFNMLWLYWFGRIFLVFFTGRQLGGLYVLGGLAGAALFVLSYNIFPYFRNVSDSGLMVGASASVMAIVFAIAFYQKDYLLNLVLLGRVKLAYVAIAVLLLDLLALTSDNAGGHIAHVGGALLGIFFAQKYREGKDITNFINRLIDKFVNMISKKTAFSVSHSGKESDGGRAQRPETDDEYRRRRKEAEDAIDEILDKLKRSGYESLSEEEKKKLFEASRK